MVLYLISIVFGMIIMLSLIVLPMVNDQKAKALIKVRISRDLTTYISLKERLIDFLGVMNVPDQFSQVVDTQHVMWSGIKLTHHQFVSLWWLLSVPVIFLVFLLIVFGSGGLLKYPSLAAVVILFILGPKLYLRHRIRSRKKEVERSLPEFLDMLALNLEVGLGFVPSLRRITNGIEGELKSELGRALVQMDLGFSRREALGDLANRLPSIDLANFVEAILLSERLGTSLARTIRVQSNMLRNRRRHRAEIQGRTAPVRIIPALVFFFLPGLLLIYLAPPIINILFR